MAMGNTHFGGYCRGDGICWWSRALVAKKFLKFLLELQRQSVGPYVGKRNTRSARPRLDGSWDICTMRSMRPCIDYDRLALLAGYGLVFGRHALARSLGGHHDDTIRRHDTI